MSYTKHPPHIQTHTHWHSILLIAFINVKMCLCLLRINFAIRLLLVKRLQTDQQNNIIYMIESQRLLGCVVEFCAPHKTYANWIFWFFDNKQSYVFNVPNGTMTEWRNESAEATWKSIVASEFWNYVQCSCIHSFSLYHQI